MMTTGKRIKLMRLLNGFTQTDLALRIQKSQRNIAMIEADKVMPRPTIIEKLASIFPCNEIWLSKGTQPAFVKWWGYAFIPPAQISEGAKTSLAWKINELVEVLKSLFVDFLEENKVTKYYLVKQDQLEYVLYIFVLWPAKTNSLFILSVHKEFWPVLDEIVHKLNRLKSITLPSKTLQVMTSLHLTANAMGEAMRELYSALKIDDNGIISDWVKYHNQRQKETQIYLQNLNAVLNFIKEKNVKIEDIVRAHSDKGLQWL